MGCKSNAKQILLDTQTQAQPTLNGGRVFPLPELPCMRACKVSGILYELAMINSKIRFSCSPIIPAFPINLLNWLIRSFDFKNSIHLLTVAVGKSIQSLDEENKSHVFAMLDAFLLKCSIQNKLAAPK